MQLTHPKQRYSVWFKDLDGNEDTITILASGPESEDIKRHLQDLKEREIVSEFIVILDSPYSLADALAYIDEKLQVEA